VTLDLSSGCGFEGASRPPLRERLDSFTPVALTTTVRMSPGAPPPDDLVASCITGDESAWRELVARHFRFVGTITRRILARRGMPHDDGRVEEATADFFGDLCLRRDRALGGFRRESSFRAYLAVLAANHARRIAESETREQARVLAYARAAAPADEVVDARLIDRDELTRALERCNPQERLLFQLLYVDGVSSREAALVLGTSADGLYLRKHRFHAKIRTYFDERFRGRVRSPGER